MAQERSSLGASCERKAAVAVSAPPLATLDSCVHMLLRSPCVCGWSSSINLPQVADGIALAKRAVEHLKESVQARTSSFRVMNGHAGLQDSKGWKGLARAGAMSVSMQK